MTLTNTSKMNSNNIRLKGGENYSLSVLFSGENDKIVIPDLQRDYCWGNEDVNLVGPFMDTLLGLDKSQDLTMGLIYGYFDEYDSALSIWDDIREIFGVD